jgi:hypothetical protein
MNIDLSQLRDKIDKHFSLEEFRQLCFDLPGVDVDNLAGNTKIAKIQSLVDEFDRHDRLPELCELLKQLRPQITWCALSDFTPKQEEGMDPITSTIVAALVAGAAAGSTKVAETAIVDGYNTLKATLKKKFGHDSDLAEAVEKLEQKPDSSGRQEVLQEEILIAQADQDPELQMLAEKLISALQTMPEGRAAVGKYNIEASNAQIGVIGDDAKVKGGIHFGDKS